MTETNHPGAEQDRRYWRRRVNRHVRKVRRTRILFRWTGIVLGNVLVASILVASSVGAFRHLTTCSELSLESIEVEGSSKTTPQALRSRLARFMGRNLLELDLGEVVAVATTDPWVREASAKRILPHALRLSVTERRPAALAVLRGVAHIIDGEGFDIGASGIDLVYDLPVLTGLDSLAENERTEALRRGARLVARLRAIGGAWTSGVSEVDVSNPDRVVIVTAEPGPRLLLDPAQVERNLDAYLALRRRIEEKVGPVEYVDLRWSHRISVLPREDPLSSGSH